MKRTALAIGLTFLLVACRQPVSYQSPPDLRDPTTSPALALPTSPTTADALPAQEVPTDASFVDHFDRPDTTLGLGDGWDMRGRDWRSYPVPLPAASDGFIRTGHYTYAGLSSVYAVKQLGGPVSQIGARGRWTQAGRGSETTMSMAMSPNDLLVTDVVQLAINRSVWELTVRRGNGQIKRVAGGQFSPILQLDHDYQFDMDITDSEVTIRVPNGAAAKEIVSSHKAEIADLRGDRVFWGEDPNGKKAGVVFDFDTVWATKQEVSPTSSESDPRPH